MAADPIPQVETELRGRLGIIILNRSKALNALSVGMVERLDVILSEWAEDASIDAVLIRSSSERAFCAGGDVRSIGELPNPAERMSLGRSFFGTEYRVNCRINTFPKPFIALINGVAMGGGLGISIHGSHRVASEDLRMAMPETVLGLFPDVGATWFLNRCPGVIGRYLALIGPHLGAADALAAGLATHHVRKELFEKLISALASEESLDAARVDAVIDKYASAPEPGSLAANLPAIERLFSSDDLDVVVAEIEAPAEATAWIKDAQSTLQRASPTSLRATWRRMIAGKGHPIERVLSDDYRMAVRIVGGHDFREGVRAILIDKDQSPKWDPRLLQDVAEADIDALLEPMADEPEFGGS